jgi:hypothetical protein
MEDIKKIVKRWQELKRKDYGKTEYIGGFPSTDLRKTERKKNNYSHSHIDSFIRPKLVQFFNRCSGVV